jgi:hypothetical protein
MVNSEIKWLSLSAILTVILWHVPGGNYILYPFTILATWFHEMSHGLTAALLGGTFTSLEIFSNGSGLAQYSHPVSWGVLKKATVAAAGPVGPPLAGFLLFLSTKTKQAVSVCLWILSLALLISTLVWVRSPFGLLAVPMLGISILLISLKGTDSLKSFSVRFLGVQACISTYLQVGYLFSSSAGSLGLSDTAQIQRALILPYWFWGALLSIFSFILLMIGLKISYRK